MLGTEKITIIVPVYNTEQYLSKSLDSIVNQTYSNLEIIVIDDGSTDNSGIICDEYSKKDSRIKVIHQQNKGLSAVRNVGINASEGEYITFVDSDDIVSSEFIKLLYTTLKKYDTDISMCGYKRIYEHSLISENETYTDGVFTTEQALRNIISDKGFCGFTWNKLYTSKLLKNNENIRFDSNISNIEDLVFNVQIFDKVDNISYTTRILYGYYMRQNSLAKTINEKTIKSLCAREIIDQIYDNRNIPDARSWHVYTIANILSFGNCKAVSNNFKLLKKMLFDNKKYFISKIHSKKEKIIFYTILINPYIFSKFYGVCRKLRK